MQELADFPPADCRNGYGLRHSTQLRERVFDRFFRVEQHHENGQAGVKGAGIGLYLCRQIIEGHGGSISYQPREDGLAIFARDYDS
jgi:signal transduction histidine kinase